MAFFLVASLSACRDVSDAESGSPSDHIADAVPLQTRPVETTVPAETTAPAEATVQEEISAPVQDAISQGLQQEAQALPADAAVPNTATVVASGELVESNEEAMIDYSNTADGYLMVQYTAQTEQRLKAQVKGPSTTYTYNLTAQEWEVFPLSDGNGTYQITIFKNVVDSKYAAVLSLTTEVTLIDEFAPFLHANQYVDYDNAPNTVAAAQSLCAGQDTLEMVTTVYNYVVGGMTYDTELAANVKSGYLPVLDDVLERMSGICFDYAALMTGMLRSQGVPCKLVVGYAGDVYHAWINVWSESTGWVEGIVYFDGTTWQRMDPTFASSAEDESILTFIGDGSNYSAKYIY